MGLITKPYTFSPGGTIRSSEVNDNFDEIFNEINGGLDASNFTNGGIINDDLLNKTVTDAKIADGVFAPLGSILDYAGSSAPTGWLFANGAAVSRSTYSALFSLIGTTYGVGDGSTTFNVPDLRGRVSAGVDNMGGVSAASRLTSASTGFGATASLGATGGTQSHTLTTTQIPAHTHAMGTFVVVNSGAASNVTSGDGANTNQGGSTGGGGAHPNCQPTLVLNKIIRAL